MGENSRISKLGQQIVPLFGGRAGSVVAAEPRVRSSGWTQHCGSLQHNGLEGQRCSFSSRVLAMGVTSQARGFQLDNSPFLAQGFQVQGGSCSRDF